MSGTSLVERLGHSRDSRLLIVSCDGLGVSHSANVGIFGALATGTATSAAIMVPGPWAREAASRYRSEDLGVELTLNAEHDLYRWGPITHGASLLDGDGGFPRTLDDTWDHSDLDEVRLECRAQIERAVSWGVDVTHLCSHMDALVRRPEFFDVYLEIALEYGLPMRLPDASEERAVGFPFRALAADEGAVIPDAVIEIGSTTAWLSPAELVARVGVGVTELVLHPAAPAEELRAFDPLWANKAVDLELVTDPYALGASIEEAGVVLIGYRQLRDLAGASARSL